MSEFHVLAEGAIPDGVTPAESAIASAINKANAEGCGKVVIDGNSSGREFLVSSPISVLLQSNVTIEWRGATLKAAPGMSLPVLRPYGANVEQPVWANADLHLINPRIDCSVGASPILSQNQCTAIDFQYLRDVTIDNPTLYGGELPNNANADSGITGATCRNVTVNGGVIRGFADAGIYPGGNNMAGDQGNGGSWYINNVTIQRCMNAIAAKREMQYLQVSGGIIEECVGGVISTYVTTPFTNPPRLMDVTGTRFKKCKANLVRYTGWTKGAVRNCVFEDYGFDYDGGGAAGANAYAVTFLGASDIDLSDNIYRMVEWPRDQQRAHLFNNATINGGLFTHGNCRFSNERYENISRTWGIGAAGGVHQYEGVYYKDVPTKFGPGYNTQTLVTFREYGVNRPQAFQNGQTFNMAWAAA